MEHYCLYLLGTPHKQPAIGFWPLAISRTAYSHPNIARSSFQLQARTQHSQLTPAVQPEASSQQLEAAVQQATSNFFPAVFSQLEARGSQLESAALAVQLIIHNSSFITKKP